MRAVIVGLVISSVGICFVPFIAYFVVPVRIMPHLRISPPTSLLLPKRVPMAAIQIEPPPTQPELHVNPVPKCKFTQRLKFLQTAIIARVKHKWDTLIIESNDDMAIWWMKSETANRKRAYHGKRRYEERILTPGYRHRWAEHNTQAWPTLATTGNARDEDLIPAQPIETIYVDTVRIGFDVDTTVDNLEKAWAKTGAFERPELVRNALVAG